MEPAGEEELAVRTKLFEISTDRSCQCCSNGYIVIGVGDLSQVEGGHRHTNPVTFSLVEGVGLLTQQTCLRRLTSKQACPTIAQTGPGLLRPEPQIGKHEVDLTVAGGSLSDHVELEVGLGQLKFGAA